MSGQSNSGQIRIRPLAECVLMRASINGPGHKIGAAMPCWCGSWRHSLCSVPSVPAQNRNSRNSGGAHE